MNRQPQPNIELHIDELILHGFTPADRYHIGEAIQGEMVRLLTEQGIPAGLQADGDLYRLDLGSFQVSHGARPDAIGIQVAQVLHEGLKNSPGRERASLTEVAHGSEHIYSKKATEFIRKERSHERSCP